MKKKINLTEELKRLRSQEFIAELVYYSLSLFSRDGEKLEYSIQSNWCGFTKTKPIREIREPSIVIPETMKDLLMSIGRPPLVVNDDFDCRMFILIGGPSIINKSVAEKYFKQLIEPKEVVSSIDKKHSGFGFTNIDSIPKSKITHAPRPKLRMKILKRDGYKCKICGRSPDNYVDIELHVHHIRPFGEWGLTEEENLITLCHTCHKGLNPHFDPDLYNLIGSNYFGIYEENDKEFYESIRKYQKLIKAKYEANWSKKKKRTK